MQCKVTITHSKDQSHEQPAADGSYAFTVTGDAEVLDPTLIGMGIFGENGDVCTTDYVVIPDPIVTSANAAGATFVDRFCGLGLFPVTSECSIAVFRGQL